MSTLLPIRFVLKSFNLLFWHLELNGCLLNGLSYCFPWFTVYFSYLTLMLDEFPESSRSCTVAETIYR